MSDERLEKLKESMFKDISAVDMQDISLDEVSLRIGNQIYKLKRTGEAKDIDIEKEIRKEYSQKLSDKLSNLGKAITSKMDEAMTVVHQLRSEAERKEKVLKDKLAAVVSMPDVTFSHAQKGLSVVKGGRAGQLLWLVRRVYWPKFVDRRPIKPAYVKKMITPVIIMVTTDSNRVVGVTTRQIGNLNYFRHYHQSSPDCWGQWSWPPEWRTPDDILKIADDAISVLENINSRSLAIRSPEGLPRFRTLQRNLEEQGVDIDVEVPRDSLIRTGVERARGTTNSEDTMWTT